MHITSSQRRITRTWLTFNTAHQALPGRRMIWNEHVWTVKGRVLSEVKRKRWQIEV